MNERLQILSTGKVIKNFDFQLIMLHTKHQYTCRHIFVFSWHRHYLSREREKKGEE